MAFWGAIAKGAMGAVKGGAKKIAADRLLNRKKKVKNRREKVQEAMGGGGEPGKGGALAIRPTTSLIPSPAGALAPTGSEGSSSGNTAEEIANNISTKVIRVDRLLAGSLAIREKVREDERKAREKASDKAQEAALEKSKDPDAKKGPKLNLPGKGLFAKIFGFFGAVILGWIAVRVVDWLPKIQPFLKKLAAFVDGVIDWGGKILNALTGFIDWSYKLYDAATGWIKEKLGEEGAEKFDTFMGNLKKLIQAFLVWKIIGEKILKGIVSAIRNVWKAVTKTIRTVWTRLRRLVGRHVRRFFGRLVQRAGGALRTAGRGILNVGKGLLSRGGGALARTGGGQAVARIGGWATKIFGKAAKFIAPALKAATPAVKGFASRIPILGPIIVAIVSLMSGEGIGQALFKGVGAALGGALGTFIPIPIVGTLLGEMVGAFVGDLLYYTIVERDPKKAFGMLKDTVLGIFGFLKRIPILGDLIRIFQEGGNVIGNFGKWLFLEAIPWAAAKIGGIGKIIADWLGSGIDRWKSTFPMFEIPNVGIQDLLYKIMDATWPKWVTDLGIAGWKPFGHLEDKPIFEWLAGERPEWLEGLPRLPRVLGWMWQNVPGLSSLVDSEGEVKGFPKFWLLGNPLFMMSHTKNAFFPGQGGGTAAEPTGGGGSSSSTSIPASISEGGGGIDTSGLDQQHQELISANQTNGYAGVMEQIESYAPYEDIASTTNIVVPAPPSTGQPPGGAQSPGGIMIAGGGGTDDAFEVLEAFG